MTLHHRIAGPEGAAVVLMALHVRAARRNGLTRDEIREVLLHTAVYAGLPTANAAFAVAQQVLDDLDSEPEA